MRFSALAIRVDNNFLEGDETAVSRACKGRQLTIVPKRVMRCHHNWSVIVEVFLGLGLNKRNGTVIPPERSELSNAEVIPQNAAIMQQVNEEH
jgi:hypothetical protein